MQFNMKNVLGFATVLALGAGVATASPTKSTPSNRAVEITNSIEKYLETADLPFEHFSFDPAGLRSDSAVEVITSSDDASALSERYGHQVRLEAVASELIYVLVPDVEKAPTEHIGTLRGEYLETMLDTIESRLEHEQNEASLVPGTTPVPESVVARAEQGCSATLCIITWQCVSKDPGCAGCAIFFCTKK